MKLLTISERESIYIHIKSNSCRDSLRFAHRTFSLAEVHSYHAKMEQFKEGGMMKELDDLNAEIAQAEKKIEEVEDEVKMKEPEIAEER